MALSVPSYALCFRVCVDTINNDSVYTVVDEMPRFRGGDEALFQFLAANIQYPASAIENNLSGKVYVKFVVLSNQSISNIEVVKSAGFALDLEALRVIAQTSGLWENGVHHGIPVNVSMVLPVVFKLINTSPTNSSPNPVNKENTIYSIVQEMPQFIGGNVTFDEFILHNIILPEAVIKKHLSGRVFVTYVILKNDSISDVKVLQGGHPDLNEEAVRVVTSSNGHWKCGRQNGLPVNVSGVATVQFGVGGKTYFNSSPHVNNITETNARNRDINYNKGVEWVGKNNYHNALASFQKAKEFDNKDVGVLYNLSAVYFMLNDTIQGCKSIQELQELKSAKGEDLYHRFCK